MSDGIGTAVDNGLGNVTKVLATHNGGGATGRPTQSEVRR